MQCIADIYNTKCTSDYTNTIYTARWYTRIQLIEQVHYADDTQEYITPLDIG